MTKFHISPKTRTPRVCTAKDGNCRYGSEETHFNSKEDALKHEEERLAKSFSTFDTLSATVKSSFQKSGELRRFSPNVPYSLEKHIAQSAENLKNYTPEQRLALRSYTGFAAGVVNNVLQKNTYEYYDNAPNWKESNSACDFNSREELKSYMEVLDESLAKRQKESRVLYRGTPIYKSIHEDIEKSLGRKIPMEDTEGLVEGLKKHYEIGKTFEYDTYLSTTSDPEIAAERTENSAGTAQGYYDKEPEKIGIMWELKTNAGLDVTGAAGASYQYERETVLPRETRFKITNVEIAPQSYKTAQKDRNNLAIVIQMEEIDENDQPITSTEDHKPKTSVEEVLTKAKM